MLKLSLWFILGLFTQLIAIIMWGEHVWLYKFANGVVGGTPLGQIQPVFWILIVIEIILFIVIAMIFKKSEE
ncbi:hypothetical protein [Virgibacillus salexigens]|uniref:DUF3923 domain-containing protein n=1 Tax=Virgibacillus kapii TaxID=1638645 RepID=A0ABQ2DXJ0_9BACI|nr:hypothetical protein [Virgibacillus kapii]GGJ77419.1 hypothetical protein GCM10007111_43790 [Virgibacillus kapii]